MSGAVHCAGLTKHYGEGHAAVSALRGVDLSIQTGEMLMLVGPSGCGKTTLISVISGILPADGGACRVFDCDWRQMTASQKTRARGRMIGFAFQSFNLIPTLSAVENAAVPLIIHRTARGPPSKQRETCWSKWDWPTAPMPYRATSPVASSSGWPWSGRWSMRRN